MSAASTIELEHAEAARHLGREPGHLRGHEQREQCGKESGEPGGSSRYSTSAAITQSAADTANCAGRQPRRGHREGEAPQPDGPAAAGGNREVGRHRRQRRHPERPGDPPGKHRHARQERDAGDGQQAGPQLEEVNATTRVISTADSPHCE